MNYGLLGISNRIVLLTQKHCEKSEAKKASVLRLLEKD